VWVLGLLLAVPVWAQQYEKAWQALHNNETDQARKLFEEAAQSGQSAVDARIALILLDEYDSKKAGALKRFTAMYDQLTDPNPFLYALWHTPAILDGSQGRQRKEVLELMMKIKDDPRTNTTMKAASLYALKFHTQGHRDFKQSMSYVQQIQAITKWAYVGPFPNNLNSGFDKNYQPIAQPKADARFISSDNAEISWFTPSAHADDWVRTSAFIPEYTAVVYAQTFVEAPADMEAILALGIGGTAKVWVNDRLILTEDEEVVSEIDTYKAKCVLKKGYNRILVQLGYTSNESPNFIVRLLDKNHQLLPVLNHTPQYQEYAKDTAPFDAGQVIGHFAENYWGQLYKQQPDNPLVAILLAKTLERSKKVIETQAIIDKFLKTHPNNPLFRLLAVTSYIADNNRTELLKEVAWLKENAPENIIALELNFQEKMEQKKYDEAEEILNKKNAILGNTEDATLDKLRLLEAKQSFEELVKTATAAYEAAPDNATFARIQYNIHKSIYKDPVAAESVLNRFWGRYYDYGIASIRIEHVMEVGRYKKGIEYLTELQSIDPLNIMISRELVKQMIENRQYDKAIEYTKTQLAISPYSSKEWENLGFAYAQKSEKQTAADAYQKSLAYDPNNYEVRQKQRTLLELPEMTSYLPKYDPYALIKQSNKSDKENEDWYYVLDERVKIVYPEWASETYNTHVIQIMNEKGVDKWKETSLSKYNGQSLSIEKAEVVSCTLPSSAPTQIIFSSSGDSDMV
jgi:predicted Zn-dependent protease